MKSLIIFYHNDQDGFGAAWTAWTKFKNKADYVAINYKDSFIKNLKNKRIFFVDFCPNSVEVMKKLVKENKEVVVIDHHISQKDCVKISSDYLFDIKHSGAVLAWKYFYPKKKVPQLLKHIEDVDIWKFRMKNSKELISAVETYPFEFKLWNKLASDFEVAQKRKKYLDEGKILIKYRNKIIDKLIESGEKVLFERRKAYAVNSSVSDLASEIGGKIVQEKGVIGIIWSYKKGEIHVSLRSDDKIDVSRIAQKYGGGGHKAASGFRLKKGVNLPWKSVKK